MKSQAELLGQLHRLSSRDRAWIVQQLSEQERAQLMSSLTAPVAGVANTTLQDAEPQSQLETKSADAARALARVDPRLVAAVTKAEPAWLNAVIVACQGDAWARAFLDALPNTLRADVERIQPKQFGSSLTESVTQMVVSRCRGNVPVESAFDRLVERLSSSRSKKRMTLHL